MNTRNTLIKELHIFEDDNQKSTVFRGYAAGDGAVFKRKTGNSESQMD